MTRPLDLALAGSKGVKVLPDLTSVTPNVGDVIAVSAVTGGDVTTIFATPGSFGSFLFLPLTGGVLTGPLTTPRLNISNIPLANPDGSPPAGLVTGDLYNNGGFVCIVP